MVTITTLSYFNLERWIYVTIYLHFKLNLVGCTQTDSDKGGSSSIYIGALSPVGMEVNIHVFTTVDSVFIAKPNLEQFWELDSLEITDSPSNSDDNVALGKLVKFTHGRYMVTWPWKERSTRFI